MSQPFFHDHFLKNWFHADQVSSFFWKFRIQSVRSIMEPHFHPLQIEMNQVGFKLYSMQGVAESDATERLNIYSACKLSSRSSSLVDSLAILWLLFPDPGLKHQVKTWAETRSKQMWVCQGWWGSESKQRGHPREESHSTKCCGSKNRGRGSRNTSHERVLEIRQKTV